MKFIEKYFRFLLIIILCIITFCCEERKWTNPFDPDNEIEYSIKSFKAEQIGVNIVVLTWELSNSKYEYFTIDKKCGEDEWDLNYLHIDGDLKSTLDTSIGCTDTIIYRINAHTPVKILSNSSKLFFTFPAPLNFNIESINKDSIMLFWDKHNYNDVSMYHIYKKINNTFFLYDSSEVNYYFDTDIDSTNKYSYHILAKAGRLKSDFTKTIKIKYGIIPGNQIVQFNQEESIYKIDLSNNNKFLLASGYGCIKEWDLMNQNIEWDPNYLNYHYAGYLLESYIICYDRSSATIYDKNTYDALDYLNIDGSILSFDASEASNIITYGTTQNFHSFYLIGDSVCGSSGNTNFISSNPKGNTVVMYRDPYIEMWDLGSCTKIWQVLHEDVQSIDCSYINNIILSLSRDGNNPEIKAIDLNYGSIVWSKRNTSEYVYIKLSNNGKLMVLNGTTLSVSDANTGSELWTDEPGDIIVFSNNDKYLITGFENKILIRDSTNGELLWSENHNELRAIDYNSGILATGGGNNLIKIFSIETGWYSYE